MDALIIGLLAKAGNGSIVGFLIVMIIIYTGTLAHCVFKIRNHCKTINAMSLAMKKKVEEKVFEEKVAGLKESMGKMEADNKSDHEKLFEASTEQLSILSFLKGKASQG